MLKYALIGCGRIAVNHLNAALKNGLESIAICDIVPERMDELIEKCGCGTLAIRKYAGYKELLQEERPELCAIATESGKHAAIALDCIDSLANVVIEKPIALSLKDADAIIERAELRGVKACACHQNRFNISIQHIRGALEEGRFGKLSHGSINVRWNRGESYYAKAPWRGTWEQDGGALMNQSIHGIDLLRWMMGDEIDEVCAYTANHFHPFIQCEDIGVAIVKFKNGAVGTIEGTTNVFPQNLEETLYLFGEKGTVKAGGESANTIEAWRFADECAYDAEIKNGLKEKTVNVYGNGHIALYRDIIQAIQNDRAVYVDARAGKRALELVLGIYLSSAKGRPVRFPLTTISSLDFLKNMI